MHYTPFPACLRFVLSATIALPLAFAQTTAPSPIAPTGSFPRIGNIWIGDYLYQTDPVHANKVQLFLGPAMSTQDASALHTSNPSALILPAVSVADSGGEGSPPDSYYMRDVNGNKIADWCSAPPRYMLNLTQPQVATFLGNYAYQLLAQSNSAVSGAFFDSFGTSVAQPYTDCYGNQVQIDSNGDGIADDPNALNAAWGAGAYLVVSTFRKLAPSAYVSGHVDDASANQTAFAAFNGTSLVFDAVNVREGLMPFGSLWNLYQSWQSQSVQPAITMVQSAPPNQIAYGYGYTPITALLPATVNFAQTYYPNMRFGLALALMNDGFFTYDFGDTGDGAPVDWWYDEYDFNLGFPLAPAAQIAPGPTPNLITNGNFASGLSAWLLNVDNIDSSAVASVVIDPVISADGNGSAAATITTPGAMQWNAELEQDNLAFVAGTSYSLQFWARSDSPRSITVFTQGGAPDYPGYGLGEPISLTPAWQLFNVSFIATATANDGRLEFQFGDLAGTVWIDNVQLTAGTSNIYRRDFTNGVVLLNGTSTPQTVSLEPGFNRFTGTQAPLYQYILDDSDASFSSTGTWTTPTYNTGSYGDAGTGPNLPAESWNANGPWYHCWEGTCHQLDVPTGTAHWNLNIPADGQYTIQVWLPAAPNASSFAPSAVYQIVSGGAILSTVTLDQTTARSGDGWHTIATLNLTAAAAPYLQVQNAGSGSLIADAVYVTSTALYNDGSTASKVTLAPFDGILLQRQQPVAAPPSRIQSVLNAAIAQPVIASGGYVSINGTGFGTTTRLWNSTDFSGPNLPTSLSGVSLAINGKPAYVEYISPTQINAIVPDDPAVGPVQVQVTTPQGASYTGNALKQALAPAFFSSQSGETNYAIAVHQDGTMVGSSGIYSTPAVPGETIEIFGTGFGPTSPASPTALEPAQPSPLAAPVGITIGGVTAKVTWAGLVEAGLDQIDVVIPQVAAGNQPIQASIAGFQSPAAIIPIAGR